MSAQDYKVTFGYGATDGTYYGPKGSVGPFHRGNDRPCPKGTPVVIAGVTIGKTGATGLVSGPHLHTQAGTDLGCQQTIDPTPLEFRPGKVVATRNTNTGSWGKYVTLQVDGKYITYAHLDEVLVSVGQEIGAKKSNDEIAAEVVQGKWGNGEDRKRNLAAAGYDYGAVQAIVNARMNKPAPQPAPAAQYYTVAKGDSLSKIAARYGTTWQKLYEMNRQVVGSDPSKIFPGQKLRVK